MLSALDTMAGQVMRYTPRMNRQDNISAQVDKRIRRSALKLVAISALLGFLIGLAVGATLAWYSVERTVVVPMSQGIKT